MLYNDALQELLKASRSHKSISEYPNTNISYDGAKNLFIEVVVAGYKKENISIDMEDNILHIRGRSEEYDKLSFEYVTKNIFSEDFERKVRIPSDYINGNAEAVIENGILTICIVPNKSTLKNIEIK